MWRDTKEQARQIVHTTFGVAAILISGEDTQPVSVRLHGREKALGFENGAERFEGVARALFQGVSPKRGDVISVAAGEAYFVETVHPADGETVAAEVTRLDDADATGLPTP